MKALIISVDDLGCAAFEVAIGSKLHYAAAHLAEAQANNSDTLEDYNNYNHELEEEDPIYLLDTKRVFIGYTEIIILKEI